MAVHKHKAEGYLEDSAQRHCHSTVLSLWGIAAQVARHDDVFENC